MKTVDFCAFFMHKFWFLKFSFITFLVERPYGSFLEFLDIIQTWTLSGTCFMYLLSIIELYSRKKHPFCLFPLSPKAEGTVPSAFFCFSFCFFYDKLYGKICSIHNGICFQNVTKCRFRIIILQDKTDFYRKYISLSYFILYYV